MTLTLAPQRGLQQLHQSGNNGNARNQHSTKAQGEPQFKFFEAGVQLVLGDDVQKFEAVS